METCKVSLLLPVYNSFSAARSDGKQLLPIAISSLLNQSFRDFELIILDNQSTDDTAKLCKGYAEADPRVRYVLDDKKRFAEEAITHLGSMANAPYIMIVNDDDIWENTYLERAVAHLDSHPKAALVYGKALFIDTRGLLVGGHTPSLAEQYGASLSPKERLIRYLCIRNVIPINFGLFRAEAFRNTLPYEDFDTLKSNVDNVFMSKFFLLGYQADYLSDMLFFYRRKRRMINPALFAPNMPQLTTPIALWLFYVNHQILFFKKMISMIESSELANQFTSSRQDILQIFLEQSVYQLYWLVEELKRQDLRKASWVLTQVIKYNRKTQMGKVNRKNLIELVEWSYTQETSEEGKHWADTIVSFLNEEKDAIHPAPSYFSLGRVLSRYPSLKAFIIFLRAIYLNIRYLPDLLSIYMLKYKQVK